MSKRASGWLLFAGCTLLPPVMALAGSPAFSRTIYLIRHGAYETDAKTDPQMDGDLTPLGIAEARLVAARLRGLSDHIESMTSSTMPRARETAAIIHQALPEVGMSESADLSECTPTTSYIAKDESATEQAECARRLDRVFKERFKSAVGANQNDLIIAHGNVIRYFVMKALGVDTREWTSISIAHASITVIQVTGTGRFRILSVGDVGHLPPNMQSWGTDTDPQLTLAK